MGPFSIVLRAPFAALAGGDQLDAYRWGSFVCVFAAGLLGLYLSRLARQRGSSLLAQGAIVGISMVNPLTFEALQAGHPEEILTAALAVGAVAVASQGHAGRTALLLGLALASKQWAVIAILPVLMALPSRRIQAGLGAAGVAVALTLPGFLADPHGFVGAQTNAGSSSSFASVWNIWYPFAGHGPESVITDPGGQTVHVYSGGSALIGRISHPLIILVDLSVPLAVAWRRRRFGLSGADALALLALLALLRSGLDSVDNVYYHEPLLLALLGWDALASRGLPVRTLAVVAAAAVLDPSSQTSNPHLVNATYLALAVSAAVGITMALVRRPMADTARAPRREAALAGALRAG